ncbi:MAG: hypothetical protein ACJATI_004182 [Halioglobus sp.]|jgi:hypothetical protein
MKLIKKVSTYYSEFYGNQEYDKYLGVEEFFDVNGDPIETKCMDKEGQVLAIEIREYFERDPTSLEIDNFESNQKQLTEYKYSSGFLMEEIEHFQNGTYFKTSYQYDQLKNIEEIQQTDENDQVLGRTLFEYAFDQKVELEYDENDTLFVKIITKFDDNNREVEIERIDYYPEGNEDREITTTTVNTYARGNLVSEEIERFGNLILDFKNQYDTHNNLISCIINNIEVDYETKLIYTHNSHNQETTETEYHDLKKVYTKEMSYDSHHSIIEIIEKTLVQDDFLKIYRQEFTIEYQR